MITPSYLHKGDKVALVSTARFVEPHQIEFAVRFFESNGYEVCFAPSIYTPHHQFAGTPEQRCADIQQILDDTTVKAIICVRGGYGTVQIIDQLDFSKFIKFPKWIVGFSDVTLLHAKLNSLQVKSIHATMPALFEKTSPLALQTLIQCLEGDLPSYTFASHPLNKVGTAEGMLIGGNLSLLAHQCGTNLQTRSDKSVLFMEDLDEYSYHIDRMCYQLKRAGIFAGLSGLLIGHFSDLKDHTIPFGSSYEEIISNLVAEYDYPLAFNLPSGHEANNHALICGASVSIEVTSVGTVMKYI